MEKAAQMELLQQQLSVVQNRIKRLEGVQDITNRLATSFHLGMVGGSGRNTRKLNKKKEAALDKTIDRAKLLTQLYEQERSMQYQIKDLQENGPEKRDTYRKRMAQLRADYWKNLKAGDTITLYTGNQIKITKKNLKSLVSENCSYSATEIIGKEAAKLL